MHTNPRPRALVPFASVLLLVGGATGCHKKTAATDTADAGPTAAVASDSVAIAATAPPEDDGVAAGAQIAPPAAVVAQDPNIPVNEAVVGTTPLPADYTAALAPPAQPVVEDQPARPEADDVWIPGYWWWSQPLNRYVWVGGAWRQPPPDQTWTPGRWNRVGARYTWSPGYWAPRGYARVTIDTPPPPVRVEVRPPMPAVGFEWTPGYYGWQGGRYEWTAGRWVRPPRAGVTWVQPRYVRSGPHYYLQPGRWDFAPERRGVVFRPDINVRAGARVRLAPVAPTVVIEHARFVRESSIAVARGAVPNARGVFIMPPRANVAVEVRPEDRGREVEERGRVVEPPGRVEERGRVVVPPPGGANVVVETPRVRVPEVHGRVEVRGPVFAAPRGREEHGRRR